MNLIKAQDCRIQAEKLLRKTSSFDWIFPSMVTSRIKGAAELYARAGNIYAGISKWDLASTNWEKSFRLSYSPDVGFILAESYEKLGLWLQAIGIYLEILSKSNQLLQYKQKAKILYRLGYNYLQIGELANGLEHLYTCVELKNLEATCYKILSLVQIQITLIGLDNFNLVCEITFQTLGLSNPLDLNQLDTMVVKPNINLCVLVGLISVVITSLQSKLVGTLSFEHLGSIYMGRLNKQILVNFLESDENLIYRDLIDPDSKNQTQDKLISSIKQLAHSSNFFRT